MVFPESPDRLLVATAGEALMDLITRPDGLLDPREGGAVYNLTRALGLQGVGTLYLNPLSRDGFGRGLADRIHAAGVALAQATPCLEPTSLAVVGLDAQGKARYSFYREGVADRRVSAAQMIEDCQARPTLQAVATGCLALAAEDQAKYLPWLQAQRNAGKLVVVDANLRPAVVPDMAAYCASVMHALGQAHVVKASDDDLALLGFDVSDPARAAQALFDRLPGARWVAITLGAQGALLAERDGERLTAREAEPVPVADTVGAGDCFLAGLLVALLDCPGVKAAADAQAMRVTGGELRAVLAQAVATASLCVMRTGCQPPTRDEVRARLEAAPPQVSAIA